MVAASSRLLTPAGRFVFSTLHPAFSSGDVRPTVELDVEGRTTEIYSVKVSSYSRSSVGKGIAIPGQPVEQWYFHRPLWMIWSRSSNTGLRSTGSRSGSSARAWEVGTPGYVYTQLPGVLITRLHGPFEASCYSSLLATTVSSLRCPTLSIRR